MFSAGASNNSPATRDRVHLEDIKKMHLRLLESSLEGLSSQRVSNHFKEDVKGWIYSPAAGAFSFKLCCQIAGVYPLFLIDEMVAKGLLS